MGQTHFKTIGLWLVLIVLFVAFYQVFTGPPPQVIGAAALATAVEADEVERIDVELEGQELEARVTMKDRSRYSAQGLTLQDLSGLQRQGAPVVIGPRRSLWTPILTQWLPIVFLFLFFTFFMRQLKGKGTKVLEWTLTPQHPGPSDVKLQGLAEARTRLKAAAEAAKSGGSGPRRVLITGAPGTGKTALLKAVAADAGLPLYAVAASEFVEVFVGVGAARMRQTLELVTKQAPCVLAIDDLDAFATRRVEGTSPGVVDERAATMLELAGRLDGLKPWPGNVLFLATTSRPELLDDAMTRPGRFELRVDLRTDGTCEFINPGR